MKKISVLLSSSGLKNIVQNKYQEDDDFVFIFGKQDFRIKSFFAEFISPVVSHLHQTDPTINTISFNDLISTNNENIDKISKSIITSDIISLLLQISSGSSIEITEEQAIKLRYLSILLGNEELHTKLNELFPPTFNEQNINVYLKNIECCYNFLSIEPNFDYKSLISFIAFNFYQLDYDVFLKIPRHIQHQIISHPKLQIESEDSLFDIIIKIIELHSETDEIDDVMFLEQIEFTELSEEKLHSFVYSFDINEMSGPLWIKLCQRFFKNCDKRNHHQIKKRKKMSINSNAKIIVGGIDKFNQLFENPNNTGKGGKAIISPPIKSSLESSSILSYSVYGWHSVAVKNDDNSLVGIGYNVDGRINNIIEKKELNEMTEFSLRDNNGQQMTPVSAVCCGGVTLYLFSKNNEKEWQLVFCDCFINEGNPVFLNIGEKQPVALFGGHYNSAAITSEGEIIFINRDSILDSPDSLIEAISLPDGEKASSVACCNHSIVALSSNGRVFMSEVIEGSSELTFSVVEELAGEEIVWVSGTREHFLAVNSEGQVFGCGSNEFGRLGIGEGIDSYTSFTMISSLQGYKIKAAYAGCWHSLFETREGKILSCGSNSYGELLLRSNPGGNVYLPTETTITEGATFCIAGGYLSVVFVDDEPPTNMPNMRVL